MAALDAVNDRFRVGNVEGRQAWRMNQIAKTPNYTTE